MKLALGTVQFGLDYGVANKAGRVSEEKAREIIELAKHIGVSTLDTAAAYGDSEQVLGRNNLDSFKVISKIPPQHDNSCTPDKWIESCIIQSLNNLAIDSLSGILLHRPLDLLKPNGAAIYTALQKVKRQGLVNKIGISVYGPDDLDKLAGFDFDIVQAPMNIIDRRLKNSGWLERLNNKGIETHIRSAFLQGLLLMPPDNRPEYFKPWHVLLKKYDQWINQEKLTPLQACIGYLNQKTEINKIIVGVDSPEQLREIYSVLNTATPAIPDEIQSSEPELINPARWSL